MFQRVRVQILDNQTALSFDDSDGFYDTINNKLQADRLRAELKSFYPSLVSVEYIDLLVDEFDDFEGLRDLLLDEEIVFPVVLLNGNPVIFGGIPPGVIKEEVDKILYSGPSH